MAQSRFINSCLAIILILTAGLPAPTGVLCIGTDGHIALEAPHSPGACDADAQVDTDSRLAGDQHPQSKHASATSPEDCADVPLCLPGNLISSGASRSTDLLRVAHHHAIDVTLFATVTLNAPSSFAEGLTPLSRHALPDQTAIALRATLLQI